ncbi:presenilin-like protein At2g29900 [Aristolochia californica]|uniref:presenilin-like protein At2g29900 n=1 Tax=Aristolochia californica TaxID=171875 RepID=UPI0035DA63FF
MSVDQSARRVSILDSLGEEINRIIAPVSICMFLVVLLVTTLHSSTDLSSDYVPTIATLVYSGDESASIWDNFTGALLNSLVFVAIVTVVTFLLVLLFYFKCIRFLKFYMGFSAFIVLGFMGGEILLVLIKDFGFPVDCITFLIVLFNFTVVGVVSVFASKMPIIVTQGYLVVIGILVAYWFTMLPEWTTWVLLVAMALYDLAAVLLPYGPLRLLVELAISRDEDIPALVYEARPVTRHEAAGRVERRVWRERRDGASSNSGSNTNLTVEDLPSVDVQETHVTVVSTEVTRPASESGGTSSISELAEPLIDHSVGRSLTQNEGQVGLSGESREVEGIGLGSSGAIKLGLGDFIFYSVLVGRAAMYDLMTVYACYLAIIAGLGITLMLLAFCRKALPALPVSIILGVVFYFLTRILLETFVVQCSVHLVMF